MSTMETAAKRLRDAYANGAVPPMRDLIEPLDGDNAYAIQAINTAFWTENGRRLVGRKVGLTARTVQVQLGVDQPDFGALFEDMEIPDGGTVPFGAMLQPKAEGEIAFTMGEDLPPRLVDRDEVAAAISHAVAAIEIVDSRIADWNITFADTVADNGAAGRFVLGKERMPIGELDLWTCGMVLEINGEIASSGTGAACLDHPLNAATWLANVLAEKREPLCKGDVILTGALGPIVAFKPGDEVKVTIAGLGTASFSCRS